MDVSRILVLMRCNFYILKISKPIVNFCDPTTWLLIYYLFIVYWFIYILGMLKNDTYNLKKTEKFEYSWKKVRFSNLQEDVPIAKNHKILVQNSMIVWKYKKKTSKNITAQLSKNASYLNGKNNLNAIRGIKEKLQISLSKSLNQNDRSLFPHYLCPVSIVYYLLHFKNYSH